MIFNLLLIHTISHNALYKEIVVVAHSWNNFIKSVITFILATSVAETSCEHNCDILWLYLGNMETVYLHIQQLQSNIIIHSASCVCWFGECKSYIYSLWHSQTLKEISHSLAAKHFILTLLVFIVVLVCHISLASSQIGLYLDITECAMCSPSVEHVKYSRYFRVKFEAMREGTGNSDIEETSGKLFQIITFSVIWYL